MDRHCIKYARTRVFTDPYSPVYEYGSVKTCIFTYFMQYDWLLLCPLLPANLIQLYSISLCNICTKTQNGKMAFLVKKYVFIWFSKKWLYSQKCLNIFKNYVNFILYMLFRSTVCLDVHGRLVRNWIISAKA